MVSASYRPATRFPSTAYVAKPIEPVIVIASPSNDGDRAEIPFSEASTATPRSAMAIPTTLCHVARSSRKKHCQYQRINRSHPHNDGRMAHRCVAQAHREAHLIDYDAEKSQIRERPQVAQCNSLRRRPSRIS